MIVFDRFVNKNLEKFLEVSDPSNLNQCFDLVVAWVDAMGLPRSFFHLYAYQIYTNATDLTKQNFTIIPNGPTNSPQKGDVVVWGKAYNGFAGHTAVATGFGNSMRFEAFSQNDPIGSPCILRTYSYKNILGWLRPKKSFDDETVTTLIAKLEKAVSEKRWE